MVLTWQAPSRREWLSWPCSSLYLVGIQCSWACKEDLSRPLLYTALPMALCTALWCLLYINTSVEENIKQILGTFQGPQVDTHTMKGAVLQIVDMAVHTSEDSINGVWGAVARSRQLTHDMCQIYSVQAVKSRIYRQVKQQQIPVST